MSLPAVSDIRPSNSGEIIDMVSLLVLCLQITLITFKTVYGPG